MPSDLLEPEFTKFPFRLSALATRGAIRADSDPVPEPEIEPETKFCVECGKKIPHKAKFCPECGQEQ